MYSDDSEEKPHPFFDNPYYAPLAQPLKNIAAIAYAPLRGFVDVLKKTIENRFNDEGNFLQRFFSNAKYEGGGTEFGILVGAFFTGLGGIAGGGFLAGTSFTSFGLAGQIVAGVMGAAAAGATGVAAGPFLLAGILGVGSALSAVAIGTVPGFFHGLWQAGKHWFEERQKEKLAPAAVAVSPPAKNDDNFAPVKPAVTRASALATVYELPEADQRAVFDTLKNKFAPAAVKPAEVEAPARATFADDGAFTAFKRLNA